MTEPSAHRSRKASYPWRGNSRLLLCLPSAGKRFLLHRVHRDPVQSFRNPLPDNRNISRPHLIQSKQARAHAVDLVGVRAVRLINYRAVTSDQ
jgi:hypothetical protein